MTSAGVDTTVRMVVCALTLLTLVGWFGIGDVFTGLGGTVAMGLSLWLLCRPAGIARFVFTLLTTVAVGVFGWALTVAALYVFGATGLTNTPLHVLLGWTQGLWLPVALFAAIWLFVSKRRSSPFASYSPPATSRHPSPAAGYTHRSGGTRPRPSTPAPKTDYSDHGGHEPWRVPTGSDFVPESARDPQRAFPPEMARRLRERAGYQCEAVYWDWTIEDRRGGWMRCAVRTRPGDQPLEADHVYPHSTGGFTTMHNGQALCHQHNVQKGAQLPTHEYVQALITSRRRYFPEGEDPTVAKR